jgi:hypothetical protein
LKKRKNEKRLELNNSNSIKSPSPINYVTSSENKESYEENSIKSIGNRTFNYEFEWKNNDTFPTFFGESNTVSVPIGVKRNIRRLPKKVLSRVDKDNNIAIEKCLVVASNLTSTLFLDENDYWKSLSSTILQKQIRKGNGNTYIYKEVINALKYSTNSTVPIIEIKKNSFGDETYENGVSCKQYKFTEQFITKNIAFYELQNIDCLNSRRKYFHQLYAKACKNIIGINLIEVYSRITIPSIQEIIAEGKLLVEKGYKTKKGKSLKLLNNKPKSYYQNYENLSFVEENLKLYNYLTCKGYMIPIIGAVKSGGRVVDSFNLMPSWIRKQCKIDNQEIVELDYTALHPNIALSIFNGNRKYLTHQQIADDLKRPVREVKLEHLSFFNKHPNDMIKSPLYPFYLNNEHSMLNLIIEDKKSKGYKNTSRLLFKKEVEIMTSCIQALNLMNIYVIYVYDALYCKKEDMAVVKEIMNKIVLKHNVFTIVK